jgi:hypothetical protein
MTKRISLLLGAAFVALTVAACEGPVGPAGSIGPEGPAGPAGPAGADAMNTCVQCHGHDTKLQAIEWQYRASAHYETVYWEREGSCRECHTHQGFITKFVNGQALPAAFEYQSPINCRTCHEVHTTFTGADYAMTTTSPVDLYVGGTANLGNLSDSPLGPHAANLCSNCHQARPISPMPTVGGDSVNVPNFRWSPHYGTQANVNAATGAFHFPGSMQIPTGPNAHGMAGCETCHMVSAGGTDPPSTHAAHGKAGGHTFNLRYGQQGQYELVKACTQCHFHANTTDFGDRHAQSRTTAQLTELRQLLLAEGIMRADGYAVPGRYHANVAAAFLNHRIFYYDGSLGVHHPQYTYAVLNNTLEVMRARQ